MKAAINLYQLFGDTFLPPEHIPVRLISAERIIPAFPLHKQILHMVYFLNNIFAGGGPGTADHISLHPAPYPRGIGGEAAVFHVPKAVFHAPAFQKHCGSPVEIFIRKHRVWILKIKGFHLLHQTAHIPFSQDGGILCRKIRNLVQGHDLLLSVCL